MSPSPSGPDAISWAIAALRGLHPLRWFVSAVGLAFCTVVLAGASAFWFADAPQLSQWCREPGPTAVDFGNRMAERSFFVMVFRIGLLFIVFGGVWSLIGCWIARHELLARNRTDAYATPSRMELTPTRLVIRNFKSLVLSCVMIAALCGLLVLPVAFAGVLNHLGGVGAIIVALILPIILIANVLLLCIGVGAVAWPLMPVTIAAENSDSFDALSRAYNYALMRPLRFVLLNLVAIAISALPLAAVLFVLAGPIENWLANSGHIAVWVAAAISLSIYWSLQSLIYLHLRTSVDGTDASELVVESAPQPESSAAPRAERPEAKTPEKSARKSGLLNQFVVAFALVAGSWFVTVWLFTRFGGEDSKWLAWGMGERFRPEVDGLYGVASLIGGFWAFLCFIAPFVVTIRRAIKGDDSTVAGTPSETQPASPA